MSDELEFSLSPEAVLACLPHISVEESRPILQAIRVEPSGLMVATQGHTLMVWQDAIISNAKPTEPLSLQFIDADARSMVKRLAKNAQKKAPLLGITVRRADAGGWLLRVDTEMMVCPAAEGLYPNWRQVLPAADARAVRAERPVTAIAVNPEYVAKFPTSSLTFAFGGDDRAILVRSAHPSWFGLLMPMRLIDDDGDKRSDMPLWVQNEADRAGAQP